MMRLAAALATSALMLAPGLARADEGEYGSEYGIESAAASVSTDRAGAHPDFNIQLALNTEHGDGKTLAAPTKATLLELPPGLLANPIAAPTCTMAQLISTEVEEAVPGTGCPQDTQIGVIDISICNPFACLSFTEPLFDMVPLPGEPARVGFYAESFPVVADTRLRSEGDYGVTVVADGISTLIPLRSASATIWGVPADPSHDTERITPYEANHNGGHPEAPGGRRGSSLAQTPLMVNPVRCGVSQGVNIGAVSYARPDLVHWVFEPLPPNTGCGSLKLEPDLSIVPTSGHAETGSGLDVDLSLPTRGFENPALQVGADVKRVEVSLPEGVTLNPSEAVGLGVCSEADFERETAESGPNEGCPESSKLGSVTATSPVLAEKGEGAFYIAKPEENPFGTLFAAYLVVKVPQRGVIVKLAAKIEPDPDTAQLVVTLGEPGHEVPQVPVSSFHLHLREGARSPLVTPPRCGTYSSLAKFTTWDGQTVLTRPSFFITGGVGGGACPSGVSPFDPDFQAGSLNNEAGAFSPFYLRLVRHDGEQDMTKISTVLPPGELGSLAGVAKCPDSAVATARAKTGRQELAEPSCPAGSLIGHTLAGAGVGEVLTYANGFAYLGGPYHGDPLSVIAITPGVAGPFDAGTIVVQEALTLNPKTAEVEVDGANSDPIPHILKGIVLKVRDLRVYVDRQNFTLNPTSCEESKVRSVLFGSYLDVLSPADDKPVDLATRYQAANCLNLGFKPKLDLSLKGGTKRGGHPGLTATYKPRKGDANIKGLVVRLPRSAFLDQAHIKTICTRVQFAAGAGNGANCPKNARYGYVKAYTPLLDEPLQGPVFLRSSNHKLPDLVFALHGIVDIEVDVRIDSQGGGIRATLEDSPDAPLSKVIVQMQGAKKGLIVNSKDLCASTNRADILATGHNGKQSSSKPVMRAQCGGKQHHRKRHHG